MFNYLNRSFKLLNLKYEHKYEKFYVSRSTKSFVFRVHISNLEVQTADPNR
jgi:hypothetical protein